MTTLQDDIAILRERPILFNGAMVREILAGRKTQTRRPVKIPPGICSECVSRALPHRGAPLYLRVPACEHADAIGGRFCSPHDAGDLLWVRECWGVTTGRERGDLGAAVRYRADNAVKAKWMPDDKPMPLGLSWTERWRPSIHMPRWASRLTLLVTDVRVQRLQDISEADACADGGFSPITRDCKVPKFAELWDGAYGAGAWDANPWVWATTFERKEVSDASAP